MVESTWRDWFVSEEVEAVEPDGLSVWFLGCNGFIARTATTTVYIDPYFGSGNPPRLIRKVPVPMDPVDATVCDAVLVTHEHLDHMHPPSYRPLVDGLGAQLYAPKACFDQADCAVEIDESDDRVTVVDVSDRIEVGDLRISVRGANDPDAIEPVSYVVEHDSGTFFHGGDSRPADCFTSIGDEFDIDVGVLAFGSVGRRFYPGDGTVRTSDVYMDENQVIEAANDLRLDRLLPTHYNMWKGLESTVESLSSHSTSFEYPYTIEPVDIGDRVSTTRPGIVPLEVLNDT